MHMFNQLDGELTECLAKELSWNEIVRRIVFLVFSVRRKLLIELFVAIHIVDVCRIVTFSHVCHNREYTIHIVPIEITAPSPRGILVVGTIVGRPLFMSQGGCGFCSCQCPWSSAMRCDVAGVLWLAMPTEWGKPVVAINRLWRWSGWLTDWRWRNQTRSHTIDDVLLCHDVAIVWEMQCWLATLPATVPLAWYQDTSRPSKSLRQILDLLLFDKPQVQNLGASTGADQIDTSLHAWIHRTSRMTKSNSQQMPFSFRNIFSGPVDIPSDHSHGC